MGLGRVANFVIRSRESFRNLIGAARFHAAEVNGLNAPKFPGSFLTRERAWERGYIVMSLSQQVSVLKQLGYY